MGDPLAKIIFIVATVAIFPTLGVNQVSLKVRGIISPVFTPIDKNGNINVDIIYQYAQYLKDNGVDGVQVAATIGEGSDLTVRDKKRLIDAWVRAAKPLNLAVVSQVGAIPLPDAEELARYSEKAGVDAIMCLPDLYYKAKTPEELVYFLQFISRAAPNTPLLYNDLPEYTNVLVDIVEFFQIATRKIPNFKGVETTRFSTALNLRKYLEKDQRIFIGDSPYLEPAALMGFDSYVNPDANYLPKLVIDIVRNGRRGNLKQTRSQFQRLRNVRQIITDQGNSPTDSISNEIVSLKAAMELITGIEVGPVKVPVKPLSDDKINSLSNALCEENIKTYDYKI